MILSIGSVRIMTKNLLYWRAINITKIVFYFRGGKECEVYVENSADVMAKIDSIMYKMEEVK